jgi:hypothetical protein
MNGTTSCRVNSLSCLDIGTLYNVIVETRKYQMARFFQRLLPGDQSADPIALLVDPSSVKRIGAPAFNDLEFHLQAVLNGSQIPRFLADSGAFLQGRDLYNKLRDIEKACLLNIAAKANHPTAGNIWPHVKSIVRIEQDRFFALVSGSLQEVVESSDLFVPVSNLLHDPMPSFEKDKSFKSKGSHATLQVTFMRSVKGDQLAADIDIDEDSGFAHTFELIRNVFKGLTNPYQVHELMLLGDQATRVDPLYRLAFS